LRIADAEQKAAHLQIREQLVTIPIPYQDITTLFLDVGNTLISIDFPWVCAELGRQGVRCNGETLQRAEAAARPSVSAGIQALRPKEGPTLSAFYFTQMLDALPTGVIPDSIGAEQVARNLVPSLFASGNGMRLWSYVLPGVCEALEEIQALGIALHVISNSDGTVEESLKIAGLRKYFGHVLDSRRVGVEKPDARIFRMALDLASCRPEESLHVGDIYNVDVLGARSAGMHAILLDPYSDWRDVDCVCLPNLRAVAQEFKRASDETTLNRQQEAGP
jgi:FMN phosphatase YigB (HAD superfamily)